MTLTCICVLRIAADKQRDTTRKKIVKNETLPNTLTTTDGLRASSALIEFINTILAMITSQVLVILNLHEISNFLVVSKIRIFFRKVFFYHYDTDHLAAKESAKLLQDITVAGPMRHSRSKTLDFLKGTFIGIRYYRKDIYSKNTDNRNALLCSTTI